MSEGGSKRPNQRGVREALMGLAFHETFTSRESIIKHLQPLIDAVEAEDWDSLRLAIRQLENPDLVETKEMLELVCREVSSEPGGATKGKVIERFGEKHPDVKLPSARTLTDWFKEIGFGGLDQDRLGR